MLDELKTTQWDAQSEAGESEAEIPLTLDPDLLPTLHIFTTEGNIQFITDEALQKRLAQTQTTDPNPPEPQEPATQQPKGKEPSSFLLVLLILLLFLVLDSSSSYLAALFTPTATITIQPQSQSMSIKSAATLGKVLSPITVSQSQTVPTTGHGHQDAKQAAGSLTFYNGLFSQQFVASGTVFTGSDGVNVVTMQPAYIPAGNPSTGYGTVTVTAQAVQKGASGNIHSGDVNVTINNGLLVKNSQFSGGEDERNFSIVTKSDTDIAAATLKAKVTASMNAALQQQTTPDERLQIRPCTPTMSADHGIGEEATSVTITVSQTCTAIAYSSQQLTVQATRLLSTQAMKKLGSGYLLYGNVQVTVTKATTTNKTVVLTFTTQGTYLYQLNTTLQQRIKALIAGKSRTTALRRLGTFPGIQQVTISGIPDDQPIPDDLTHIHLLIIVEG